MARRAKFAERVPDATPPAMLRRGRIISMMRSRSADRAQQPRGSNARNR